MPDIIVFRFGDEGDFVVDSRLVALELNIEHVSFMKTVYENQEEIEEAFGVIVFDTESPTGRGRPQKFAYLNEGQATVLMTFSQNTPQVKRLKIKLVKAFQQAKEYFERQNRSSFNEYTLERIKFHHSVLSLPLPDGYFSCFDKMIEILQKLDTRLGYQLGEQWYDRSTGIERFLEPDISIGIHFSKLFTSDLTKAINDYETEYQARISNPRIKKLWNEKLISLRWKLDRVSAESRLRAKYFRSLEPLPEDEIKRLRYNFKPAPDSNRPSELDAYCYSNDYTSLFYEWIRDVFFKFCWRSYVLERDSKGWMKRYNQFLSLPEAERRAILTTSEGGMISGFEFPDIWKRQLPSD
jgi:phage regulator Rha-like protein